MSFWTCVLYAADDDNKDNDVDDSVDDDHDDEIKKNIYIYTKCEVSC